MCNIVARECYLFTIVAYLYAYLRVSFEPILRNFVIYFTVHKRLPNLPVHRARYFDSKWASDKTTPYAPHRRRVNVGDASINVDSVSRLLVSPARVFRSE